MKRVVLVAVVLVAGLTLAMTSAGAAPGGTVPVAGSGPELSFSGTLTVTGFAAVDKQLTLEGTLVGPLTTSGGTAVDLKDLPVQLPVDTLVATCAALADQVCQAAADLQGHGRLKGRRLGDAVDALNALGGIWQLAP